MVPQVSVAFLLLGFKTNHHRWKIFLVFANQDFRSLSRNHIVKQVLSISATWFTNARAY
jgi:hypothetical protein